MSRQVTGARSLPTLWNAPTASTRSPYIERVSSADHRGPEVTARHSRLAITGVGVLGTLGVALVSINLRPGAASVGPVLEEVRDDVGLSATVAGLMTALPCLCFGLVGALAVTLAKRIGVTAGVAAGLVAITTGLLLRSLTGNGVGFLLLSTLALAGMALGNILVPAWIKRHSSDGGTRGMTIYSTGLAIGGSLGSLFAAPVAQSAPGGWRGSLALWGLVAGIAVIPWLALTARERRAFAHHTVPPAAPPVRLRASRTAVLMCVYFGMQSMNAYVQFGGFRRCGVTPACRTSKRDPGSRSSPRSAFSAGSSCPASSTDVDS
ncbi:MFS transporter [Dermacoccus abyssi]|uniref:MFS transporter n=1 Tax=Dermacoccus abyssi TaxID=322596 RepID=A0A417Z2R5_9MICO|nr:MFS transporter [Dermacoccus abyssi]